MNGEVVGESRAGARRGTARSVGEPGIPNPHVPVDCADFVRVPIGRKVKFVHCWNGGRKSKLSVRRVDERWVVAKFTDLQGMKEKMELDLVAKTAQLIYGDESGDMRWAAVCTQVFVDRCREYMRHQEASC